MATLASRNRRVGFMAGFVGLAMVGIGLNYVPLSAHALSLRRPEALEAELEGVDVVRELRRYTFIQLWVVVPLAFVVFDLSQRRAAADADA